MISPVDKRSKKVHSQCDSGSFMRQHLCHSDSCASPGRLLLNVEELNPTETMWLESSVHNRYKNEISCQEVEIRVQNSLSGQTNVGLKCYQHHTVTFRG